ncbi:MAG: hypothetical protein A2Y76_01790 [Planctomycetes bacterium RBG_13_60_9]|nr:MAG: hypothetical protein A2Y76_01790 [Planctomycetes bacterium RBG_13_60_9]
MSVPAPPTTETLVRVPPASSRPEDAKEATITATFDDRDLRDALQHISTLAGVPIIPDANITGRVTATFKDVPLEVALEIVLAGKPYVFRRTPRCYLVVARTATGNAGNRGSNPRRRQVLLDARVVVME